LIQSQLIETSSQSSKKFAPGHPIPIDRYINRNVTIISLGILTKEKKNEKQ